MFEKIEIVNCSECLNLTLENPKTIKFYFDGRENFYTLNKESKNSFYSILNFTYAQSKSLYQVSLNQWKTIFNFDILLNLLNQYKFVIQKDLNLIIGIYNDFDDDKKLNFYHSLQSKNILCKTYERIITNVIDNIKLIYELDYNNSNYSVYIEKYLEEERIFIPAFNTKNIFNTNSFESLFNFDISDEISTIKLLKDTLSEFEIAGRKYSLREIYKSFKLSKLSVNLNENGKIKDFKNVSNGIVLINYFNGFDFAFKTIKTLTELQKSILFKEFSVIDLLKFYSGIYENNPEIKISIECINYLFDILENLDYDTLQLKD